MAVLSSEEIRRRILEEGLIRDYIDLETQLQPNGFDCTLRAVAKLKGCGRIDFDNSKRQLPETEEIEFSKWVYLPKGVYRAYLNEIVSLGKDLMALARPRSTLVRAGANVLTAVWDAGYTGRSEVGLVVQTRQESGSQGMQESYSLCSSSLRPRLRATKVSMWERTCDKKYLMF